MHVLWEHSAVADPAAHDAKRRKRWLIAGAIAAVSALTVLSFGVWGLVYPAIVLVIAALVIEPMYWLRQRMPTQRVWTDGSLLGVDGAAEVIAQPDDPIPLSSVTALAVYPIAGGFVDEDVQTHYVGVDLWLTDGTRRLWIFNRITGITVEVEVALARALAIYLPDRWRDPPADGDMGADVGKIDRRRLAEWPVG